MRNSIPACLKPPAEGVWAPPLDVQDVVIRLEAAGITGGVAKREYGCPDLWALARLCFASQEQMPVRPVTKRRSLVLEYIDGIAFALPLLLCALSMALFESSLWGGAVESGMASATGLGTVTSFIAAGGFVQLLARRVLFHLGTQNRAEAVATCKRWTRHAIAFLLLSGLLVMGLSRAYCWLPRPYEVAAFGFHVILGLFWISSGLLQMLKRIRWTVAGTAIGIAVVLGANRWLGMPLAAAQFCGILSALAVTTAAVVARLRPDRALQGCTRPDKTTEDLFYGWPYFLYGFCYYALVFADRLLCWTTPTLGAPSALLFRGDYETALDIALIAFVAQAGFVQVFTRRFFERIEEGQEQLPAYRHAEYLQRMQGTYLRQGGLLLLVSACCGALICAAAWDMHVAQGWMMQRTLALSAFGNSLLAVGLWNANLLLRLSRPREVVTSIYWSLAAAMIIGYPASRLGVYQDSIYGFVAGGTVLLLLTFDRVLTVNRSLDFYHYAADA